MNSIVKAILRRPFFIYSILSLTVFAGIYGFFNIDRNLFPNSNRPEIALVVISPSSSAQDIAQNVASVIENELYTLDNIRRVYSSSADEVTVIKAEFNYGKEFSQAATEVKNAFDKVRAQLPQNILEPQIHKITEATAPIVVIGLSSQTLNLAQLSQLAQDDLKNSFLSVNGVANVDIFGGYKNEITIEIDKQKLDAHGLSFAKVYENLSAQNKDYAVAIIDNDTNRYLLKSSKQTHTLQDLQNTVVAKNIRLSDIATIAYAPKPIKGALYQGNGNDAIALSIQREVDASVVTTIENVEQKIRSLQPLYPQVNFAITDTQKTTIEQSTSNMIESLRNAIAMSMVVVFLFLASFRQIIVVLLTVPVVYITTISLMYLFGIEFNVITLTAVILALGLLLDDTVVVVENIQRHFHLLKKPINKAVEEGTSEIMFADFSGTLTTLAAIFPILFVGEYPQTIFGPLIATLILALLASYFISISFVPLISKKVLAINSKSFDYIEGRLDGFSAKINDSLVSFFDKTFDKAIKQKKIAALYIAALLALFVISVKIVMPLAGQELMPAMDNGAIKIELSIDADAASAQSKAVADEITAFIKQSPHFLSSSTAIGQEAGVLSIGSGGGINQITMIVNYVNRFEREESIWQIQNTIRQKLRSMPQINEFRVSESGAVAMSSIKSSLATTLQGDDVKQLFAKSIEFEDAMRNTQGIVDVKKSWTMDKKTYDIKVDTARLEYYGLNKEQLLMMLKQAVGGVNVGSYNFANDPSLQVVLKLQQKDTDSIEKIKSLTLPTNKGAVALHEIASIEQIYEPTLITRENLNYTIDVMGVREKEAISHINSAYEAAIKDIELPATMHISDSGDMSEFKNSSSRIIKAVGIGIVLIFIVMVPIFNSLKVPLIVILSIPLTVVGASWILLLFDYHSSMSAMVGFILLAGVIVNNAILLIYFAIELMHEGLGKIEAMKESIKIRTRPVIMTSLSICVGMLPVAFGMAIGLERLAPLGAVVVGGLIVGTFLTLVFIPLFFVWFYSFSKN